MLLIFDLLLCFRMHPIVMTADIEKAFLQIGNEKADSNFLRLLWFDDIAAN